MSQPQVAMITTAQSITNFGPNPQQLLCPSCHAHIKSNTERKATTRTHLAACILCCFFCYLCCCCPYCIDSCNNIDHYCPNCSAYLGTYAQ